MGKSTTEIDFQPHFVGTCLETDLLLIVEYSRDFECFIAIR